MTIRYWPFWYAVVDAASPPSSVLIFVGPFADASLALPPSQRRRYTASESSPIRKYGRSLPATNLLGNWSETASAKSFFAASAKIGRASCRESVDLGESGISHKKKAK